MVEQLNRQEAFSGVKEVSEKLIFNSKALEEYLVLNLEGFKAPLSVKQFKGGQSNPTYLLETPQKSYVLRRKPPGLLLPSAHAVEREYKVLCALYAQGFPVAKPYLLEENSDIIGTPFYIMDFVEGRIIWDPAIPMLQDNTHRAQIYDVMIKTIAKLHSYDPQSIGLGDYGKGENYVSRQVERWSKQYRASETQTISAMDEMIAWLPQNIPPQQAVRIVHGDFRLDNTIIHPQKPQVLAVLDWELSTLGDPLADFTYYLMAWVMPRSHDGSGTGTLIGLDLKSLQIPSLEEVGERYSKLTGLDAMPHLNVYMAYNLFRLGAILQGIIGRVRDGTAANANAGRMAHLVEPLGRAASHFAQKA